jgi:hypothetical protein
MTASSIYFQSFPYSINSETHLIDYEALEKQAKVFKPKLIICGASAYPRDWDYAALKKVAEKEGAFLMADIAHTSGLVAGQQLDNPFEYCDVVTTTTYVRLLVKVKAITDLECSHKTLRGPRAGLIFFRKDLEHSPDLEKRVNEAVFPACQGGPHNNVGLVYFGSRVPTALTPFQRPLLVSQQLSCKLPRPLSATTQSKLLQTLGHLPLSSLIMATSSKPGAQTTTSSFGIFVHLDSLARRSRKFAILWASPLTVRIFACFLLSFFLTEYHRKRCFR